MLDLILEKINELSSGGITGIATLLFVIIAIFGFIKGAVRLVFLVCILAGAGYAAYWASENGLQFLRQYWASAPDIAGSSIAIIAAVVSFFILYKIFNFLVNPFENNSFISRIGFGIPSLLISGVVAAAIAWFGITQLRQQGAQQEIQFWISQNSSQPLKKYPALASLKQKFESTALGKKISSLYAPEDNSKYNLAKLIVIANTSAAKYQQLSKDKRAARILRHPEVRRLIASTPDIQQAINNNDPTILLSNPAFLKLLQDPNFLKDLAEVSSDSLQ